MSLEQLQAEFARLEDENLRLHEGLNHEKQRVLDLKNASQSRRIAWKEELEQITKELAAKHVLEEEVAALRLEQARLHKKLCSAAESEQEARRAAEELVRRHHDALVKGEDPPVPSSGASPEGLGRALKRASAPAVGSQIRGWTNDAEADDLDSTTPVAPRNGSSTSSGEPAPQPQGGLTEHQVAQQLQQNSRLLELFLQHSHPPLGAMRRCIRHLSAAGPASGEPRPSPAEESQAPPLHDPDVRLLQVNLVKIVELLRFSAEVLEAQEKQEETKSGTIAAIEGGKEHAKALLTRAMSQVLG